MVMRGATLEIAFRQAQSLGTEIDAMPQCRRPGAGQTHGDGPRASAEVSPASGRGGFEMGQGKIHQQFCLLTGNQGSRSGLKQQVPPGTKPD